MEKNGTLTDCLLRLYPDGVYECAMNLNPARHALLVEGIEDWYREHPDPYESLPFSLLGQTYEEVLCREYHERMKMICLDVFAIRAGKDLLERMAADLEELESWTHIPHTLTVCDGLELTARDLRDLKDRA